MPLDVRIGRASAFTPPMDAANVAKIDILDVA